MGSGEIGHMRSLKNDCCGDDGVRGDAWEFWENIFYNGDREWKGIEIVVVLGVVE